jgi:hypothetical protein
MGIWEQLRGLANVGAVVRGIGVAAVLVVVNGVAAFNWIPSSYQQFSWTAYAGVVYTETPTATPTQTPTSTPTVTNTPSSTPTATAVADGGSCSADGQCESGFCVESVCCDTICDQPGLSCASGTCLNAAAPAPAASHRTLLLIVTLLAAIGYFALTPLGFGKRR